MRILIVLMVQIKVTGRSRKTLLHLHMQDWGARLDVHVPLWVVPIADGGVEILGGKAAIWLHPRHSWDVRIQ